MYYYYLAVKTLLGTIVCTDLREHHIVERVRYDCMLAKSKQHKNNNESPMYPLCVLLHAYTEKPTKLQNQPLIMLTFEISMAGKRKRHSTYLLEN